MIVEPLQEKTYAEWDAYVDSQVGSTCYHLRAWKAVAERAYRLRAPFLLLRERTGGPVVGALPLFIVRNPLGGYVTNGLFGAYGGALADHASGGAALLEAAQVITRAEGAAYLAIKSLGDAAPPAGFDRRDASVIATLALDADPKRMWIGFTAKIRNMIRQAHRAGFECRVGADQLGDYYDVLAENMHRKGTPIYGLAFMRELVRGLGDSCEVMTLRLQARAVSAALIVYHHQVAYAPFASSRAAVFQLRPNNLLYWEIIRRGCLRGMQVLDFGRSPRGSGALAFKRGWGARVVPQPFLIHTVRGKPPSLDAESPNVRRLIALWRRLPRFVADAVGPMVCSRFLV